MARDDDWEDDEDDRPRRRRNRDADDEDDDDDDYDRPRRMRSGARSGAVTTLGVINIVLGALVTLGSLCFLMFGVLFAGVAMDANRGGPNPGAGLIALGGFFIVIFGFLCLLAGVGMLLAGIGLLNRRNWARILTLVIGGFFVLAAFVTFLGLLKSIGANHAGPVLFNVLILCLEIGYVVMAYAILLNGRFAAEFR